MESTQIRSEHRAYTRGEAGRPDLTQLKSVFEANLLERMVELPETAPKMHHTADIYHDQKNDQFIKVLRNPHDRDNMRAFLAEVHDLDLLSDPELGIETNLIGTSVVKVDGEYRPAIIMKNAGKSLEELHGSKLMLWTEIIDYMEQAAHILKRAHMAGVMHTDLKLEHIRVNAEGKVSIIDWGLSNTARQQFNDEPGLIRATPRYLAPEQLKAQELEVYTDTYQLALSFYRLVNAWFSKQDIYQDEFGQTKQWKTKETDILKSSMRLPENTNTLELLRYVTQLKPRNRMDPVQFIECLRDTIQYDLKKGQLSPKQLTTAPWDKKQELEDIEKRSARTETFVFGLLEAPSTKTVLISKLPLIAFTSVALKNYRYVYSPIPIMSPTAQLERLAGKKPRKYPAPLINIS